MDTPDYHYAELSLRQLIVFTGFIITPPFLRYSSPFYFSIIAAIAAIIAFRLRYCQPLYCTERYWNCHFAIFRHDAAFILRAFSLITLRIDFHCYIITAITWYFHCIFNCFATAFGLLAIFSQTAIISAPAIATLPSFSLAPGRLHDIFQLSIIIIMLFTHW